MVVVGGELRILLMISFVHLRRCVSVFQLIAGLFSITKFSLKGNRMA